MKSSRISNRELDIMNIFWEKGEPLIASEIVSFNPQLSISTVQTALRSLVKKNYLKVADIVYSGKVLTRKYEVVKSPNDYLMDEIQFPLLKKNTFSMNAISALLNGEKPEKDILEELEIMIAERKRSLERTEEQ